MFVALKEWLLFGLWESLNIDTLATFKGKVSRVSLKCWPKNLPMNGNLTWLHHNHCAYSGNVPMWADWEWPKGKDVFRTHFYCLLIGQHPAGGNDACCSRILCKDKKRTSVYNHHYFECVDFTRNQRFFKEEVKRLYRESQEDCARRIYGEGVADGQCVIPLCVVDDILVKPCGMWVGLFDPCLFELGLKLCTLHELHRIVTMASVLSWGRFYTLPGV